ncbi:hypothetical protein EV714DRAFT_278489 [Schizophyllum commune]
MRRASQEVKYEAGERFWSYVLRVMETLGFDGMSDEESDEEEVTYSNNFKAKVRYRKVLKLEWRHPSLRSVFEKVDAAPILAQAFFNSMASKNKLRRVRVEQLSARDVPKKLPKALFDPEFLEGLTPVRAFMLDLTDEPFQLFDEGTMEEELP